MTETFIPFSPSARWTARRAIRRIYAGLPAAVRLLPQSRYLTEGGTPTDVDELVRKASGFVRTGRMAAA